MIWIVFREEKSVVRKGEGGRGGGVGERVEMGRGLQSSDI